MYIVRENAFIISSLIIIFKLKICTHFIGDNFLIYISMLRKLVFLVSYGACSAKKYKKYHMISILSFYFFSGYMIFSPENKKCLEFYPN